MFGLQRRINNSEQERYKSWVRLKLDRLQTNCLDWIALCSGSRGRCETWVWQWSKGKLPLHHPKRRKPVHPNRHWNETFGPSVNKIGVWWISKTDWVDLHLTKLIPKKSSFPRLSWSEHWVGVAIPAYGSFWKHFRIEPRCKSLVCSDVFLKVYWCTVQRINAGNCFAGTLVIREWILAIFGLCRTSISNI